MSEEVKDVDVTQKTEDKSGEVKENLLTQEQVDKIVTKRLAREREKYEAELAEEKRLAQLSADEKAEALRQKKEKELESRERELKFRELDIQTRSKLTELGIPVEFSEYLIKSNEEDTNLAVEEFDKLWHSSIEGQVEKQVEERLRGRKQEVEVNLPGGNNQSMGSLSDLANSLNIRK